MAPGPCILTSPKQTPSREQGAALKPIEAPTSAASSWRPTRRRHVPSSANSRYSNLSLPKKANDDPHPHPADGLPPPPPPRPRCPAARSATDVLLQGFNWESCRHPGRGWYRHLSALAPRLAALGATKVWLPPPTDSVSEEGYLPRDLYDLDSNYGTADELRDAVRALHDAGMKARHSHQSLQYPAISKRQRQTADLSPSLFPFLAAPPMQVLADVVINHRCAHAQSPTGCWNRFGGRLGWDDSAIVADDLTYEVRLCDTRMCVAAASRAVAASTMG